MSHAMKVKTVTAIFLSAYCMPRFGLSSLYLLFLMFTLMLKERVPRNNLEKSVQQAYWGELLRTPVRDWPGQGWADKEVATEASANPKWGAGTGMNLQSCPNWGKEAVPCSPATGFRLPLGREPNLGRDSSLGQTELPSRKSPGSLGQSLLQAALGRVDWLADWCLTPGGGVWVV